MHTCGAAAFLNIARGQPCHEVCWGNSQAAGSASRAPEVDALGVDRRVVPGMQPVHHFAVLWCGGQPHVLCCVHALDGVAGLQVLHSYWHWTLQGANQSLA